MAGATNLPLDPSLLPGGGVVIATQAACAVGSSLLDIGVMLGSSLVFLVISAWALRRQAAELAII